MKFLQSLNPKPYKIAFQSTEINQVSFETNLEHKLIHSDTVIEVGNGLIAVLILNREIVGIIEQGQYLLNWTLHQTTPSQLDSLRVVYFSKKSITTQRWGTSSPIMAHDHNNQIVKLRAHGSFAYRIHNPKKLWDHMPVDDKNMTTQQMSDMLRPTILSRFSHEINQTESLEKIIKNHESLITKLSNQIALDFHEFGLKLEKFWIQHISLAE